MRVDELDEWQGVTPEMVREWLRNRGWSLHGEIWERGRHNFADCLIDGNSDDVAFVIHCEEIAAGLSRQEARRQIDPRMRKGWPNTGALSAHKYWLAKPFGDDAFCVVWTTAEIIDKQERAGDVDIGFWPCDANGNKVRWPTDANGAML